MSEVATARPATGAHPRAPGLSAGVYDGIKAEIFGFKLLPGERFTEAEVAARMGVSRTPVREALHRLAAEGYLEVMFRSGWRVRPIDFALLDDLYDLRVILELAAARRLCEMPERPALEDLKAGWLVPPEERLADGLEVARLDEAFHAALVGAAGNAETARVHREVTERIRIVRRLDFTNPRRIEATYQQHAKILRAILQRRIAQAQMLIAAHVEESKAEVRKITLHKLHTARAA